MDSLGLVNIINLITLNLRSDKMFSYQRDMENVISEKMLS